MTNLSWDKSCDYFFHKYDYISLLFRRSMFDSVNLFVQKNDSPLSCSASLHLIQWIFLSTNMILLSLVQEGQVSDSVNLFVHEHNSPLSCSVVLCVNQWNCQISKSKCLMLWGLFTCLFSHTVDVLDRLENVVGVKGTIPSWLRSYYRLTVISV